MKYIIILGDGMADEPIEVLGGLTPLQKADTPNMDKLAMLGINGTVKTVPEGFAPGSEIANLAVLGYDLPTVFEGRGSLEAASMGIDIEPGEVAMRCNLITVEDGLIRNHSAGHISNEEAKELIEYLQQELGDNDFNFFNGVSYRHLLKIRNASKQLECTPPHDVLDEKAETWMIKPLADEAIMLAKRLNELIVKSQEILPNHPVNKKRIAAGKAPANSIWPWSPGYKPSMKTLHERYPNHVNSGSVISAVDLIKGIGRYAGLDVIEVEGATGLYDTNYEGKCSAAIEALKKQDFVFLHIEASDEAGHEGDVDLKIRTIEDLDQKIVKPILEEVAKWNEAVAIALLPDHPTPCATRTHTDKPIPFTIYKPLIKADSVSKYDEFSALNGSVGEIDGKEFMKLLIQK